ncbi:MAG TPA: protein-glutamate O-methyltransferase CheR [Terriglobales bacterium]|nr:protein-glutamate O-methyltransferase CheR [Terriglobales bacterium]
MTSSAAAPALNHFGEIRQLLEQRAGILLDQHPEFLSQRISDYAASRGLGSLAELLALLRSSAMECDALQDQVLVTESRFFRHALAFETLEKVVIPELRMRKFWEVPRALRLWSAGCGTGEEAYSMAIALSECVDVGPGWQIQVIASDLSRHALHQAERGLYSRRSLDGIPLRLLQRYFVKVGEHFLVKPEVRNLVSFVPGNLGRTAAPGSFDCIFFVDVLHYLARAARPSALKRFDDALKPGGYILLAPGEALPNTSMEFHERKHGSYRFYQKPASRRDS